MFTRKYFPLLQFRKHSHVYFSYLDPLILHTPPPHFQSTTEIIPITAQFSKTSGIPHYHKRVGKEAVSEEHRYVIWQDKPGLIAGNTLISAVLAQPRWVFSLQKERCTEHYHKPHAYTTRKPSPSRRFLAMTCLNQKELFNRASTCICSGPGILQRFY